MPAPVTAVVLPFENLGAAEDAYFAAGMTDEISSRLAGVPGLADMIMRYAKGESSYGTLRRRVIAKFPMAALGLVRQKLGEVRRAS